MSRFNHPQLRGTVTNTSPIRSEPAPTGVTGEGGPGWARDPQSELFLLAVTNLCGQDTFYENAMSRDDRYVRLIRQVAVTDPHWMYGFLAWLRNRANLRTAALIGAAEAVAVRSRAGQHTNPLNGNMISCVLQRADEPGEFLAYWQAVHATTPYGEDGRPGTPRLPQAVRKGLGDAVRRLYDERSTLRYDTGRHPWRFGDVLNTIHPHPTTPWQDDLFHHLLDRRYQRDAAIPASLTVLNAHRGLTSLPVAERRRWLEATAAAGGAAAELRAAGMSWEAMSGWLQGPMDATAWTALIPTMGYMALLRNLRNFDRAGVADEVAEQVASRFMDPELVQRSRVLPLQYLAAYRNAPSLRWSYPLEVALGHSLRQVPWLPGRTLILVDRSGSMNDTLSGNSELTRGDAAALFGSVLALRCEAVTLVQYGTSSAEVTVPVGGSALRMIQDFQWLGGTDTFGALFRHYQGHDRVVILTDEQAAPWEEFTVPAAWRGRWRETRGVFTQKFPGTVPVYTWNLAGYTYGHSPSGYGEWHTFGGLNDSAFNMIPLIEGRRLGSPWPWK